MDGPSRRDDREAPPRAGPAQERGAEAPIGPVVGRFRKKDDVRVFEQGLQGPGGTARRPTCHGGGPFRRNQAIAVPPGVTTAVRRHGFHACRPLGEAFECGGQVGSGPEA